MSWEWKPDRLTKRAIKRGEKKIALVIKRNISRHAARYENSLARRLLDNSGDAGVGEIQGAACQR